MPDGSIIRRPDSRASTTSATSHHNDAQSQMPNDAHSAPEQFMTHGAQAALLHYQPNIAPYPSQQFENMASHHPNHHTQTAPFAMQGAYGLHESPYVKQDMTFKNHVRVGSVPIQAGGDMSDDKRRKGSAVTATNDKELREMLSKNEGRPLRDVAQEVIQKERTPMAEKTKQLFAMLW